MVPLSPHTTLIVGNRQYSYNFPASVNSYRGTGLTNYLHDNLTQPVGWLSHPGPVASLEDFQGFKQGYECTSSRLGSMETVPKTEQGEIIMMNSEEATSPVRSSEPKWAVNLQVMQANGYSSTEIETWELVDVQITMLKTEHRFGFSVMGGRDEGFRPRIDDISPGSPADRADLEVGDEIVEVNGRSLEDASHAEVIQYIHQCIRSKSICLRVKRQKNQQPVNVPQDHNIQNAYIVAVEEDAKRRLEELVYNRKLTPIDMTHNLSRCTSNSDEFLGSSNSVNNSVELQTFPYSQSSMPFSNRGQHVTNGHVEMSDMNGYKERDTPRKGKEKPKRKSRPESNVSETPLIASLMTSNNGIRNSQDSLSMDDSFSDSYVEDNGPHREMAIDVPDDFHGNVKTPPRYPGSIHSETSSQHSGHSMPFKSTDSARNAGKSNNYIVTHPNEEQLERIRKHQEDIRKRREEEERRAKEEEFLRASLRGSKKMVALAQRQPQSGKDNLAFIQNDDESGGFEEGYVSGRQTQTGRDYMKKNLSVDDIHASLQHIQSRVTSPEGREKLKFLTNLLNNRQFQNAVEIHHRVLEVKTRDPPVKPTSTSAQDVFHDAVASLQSSPHPQATELANLLNKHHVKGLIYAHDRVAIQESRPPPEQPPDDYNFTFASPGDTVRIVHLEKTSEPLGATVRNEGESVIISRIVKGGTAEKSGLLHEGDEILDINGVDMKGKDVNDVSEMLANMSGTITFTIIPTTDYNVNRPVPRKDVMHVKPLFNYDPEDDPYIPCRELGISFMKGDILHVINQEDANWWQAYREGEEEQDTLAGLIPSKSFHEQREAMRVTLGDENKENQKKSKSCACGRSNKKKRKKNFYKNQVDQSEEILSYEEVALYYPEPFRRRPIILIGPQNVGRHELRHRLMESDFDRFAAAIPHTSRPIRQQIDPTNPNDEAEVDGKDYFFVPRAIFQADIIAGKFIEHGEFEKNLYGTSVEAVRQVISQGKICVLNLDPEALYILKNTDLKPYVVFVRPSNLGQLRQIQEKFGMTDIRDESLKEIIEKAREMEDKFGHFFDYILVNTDVDRAYAELIAEINRIEVEPQWVPTVWLR